MAKYAAALSKFVLNCETPMTVGLQGEWGSGKTSLMNMMRHELATAERKGAAHIFDFQTWQYGALNQDEYLGILLMKAMLQEFIKACESNDKVKWLSNRIISLFTALSKGASQGIQARTGFDAELAIKEMSANSNAASDLMEIRKEFETIVKEITRRPSSPDGRVIIFIDDLDRIRPSRAVALLEVVKNFMDVPNCVFVIACDYDVVKRGVEARLGIGKDEKDKAEAFFHKLIQVPFSMPSHSYSMHAMLSSHLTSRGNKKFAKSLDVLSPMVQIATGTNPRAFKRFLNRVDLHSCIQHPEKESSDLNPAALIGLVAMQIQWPQVTAHLSQIRDLDKFRVHFQALCEGNQEAIDDGSPIALLFARNYGDDWTNHPSIVRLGNFMDLFLKALDTNRDGSLSSDELQNVFSLAQSMGLTLVDTSGEDETTNTETSNALLYEEWKDSPSAWKRFLHSLATELWTDRRRYDSTVIARSSTSFILRSKKGPSILSFYGKATLYVYTGKNASSAHYDAEAIGPIADVFRRVCEQEQFNFQEFRNQTSCAFKPEHQSISEGTLDKFHNALLSAVRQIDSVLSRSDLPSDEQSEAVSAKLPAFE